MNDTKLKIAVWKKMEIKTLVHLLFADLQKKTKLVQPISSSTLESILAYIHNTYYGTNIIFRYMCSLNSRF